MYYLEPVVSDFEICNKNNNIMQIEMKRLTF